jgi:hypothetical protein
VKTGELYRGYLTEAEVTYYNWYNCEGFDECEDGQCDSHHERRKSHCFGISLLFLILDLFARESD